MGIKKHSFLKDWKRVNRKLLMDAYPEVSKKEIDKFLDRQIERNLVNTDCELHNNYIHKSIKTNLLELIDWIRSTKPICAGNAVFYKNQHDVKNPLSEMIMKFLKLRKEYKKQLWNIKDPNSYEYKTFDRKQLSEKVNANSIYGCLGMVMSFLFNLYTAQSVTITGQSLISTTCAAFESFMTNNVKFNNLNECMTYLTNISDEKHKLDDDFLIDVDIKTVMRKLVGMFYDYRDEYDDILMLHLSIVPQNILNRIYYKNNLYEFSKLSEIKALLTSVVKSTEEFKDPNDVPESTKPYLEELWQYYKEFVVYNHFYINRIQRYKNDKRRCVLAADTDSNILTVDPWVKFMNETIIGSDVEIQDRDKTQLWFISVNTIAYMLTHMVMSILAKYTKTANIPEEFRKYINMKNEFLFSRLILASAKKRYITSVRLREGKEIWPEKLDIKGFDFIKSSSTEDTKKRFLAIIKKRLLDTNEIDITTILRELDLFEKEILDSLKNGDKKYLTPASVKEEGAYKSGLALRNQGFRAICIWNYIYPHMEIELPAKVDIVKVTLDDERNLQKLKHSNPDIYQKIETYIIGNRNKDIADKLVPVIAIPRNVDTIPDWIIPFIDYETISVDVLKKFYSVLESLGLTTIKTSKKEYFSNIINI